MRAVLSCLVVLIATTALAGGVARAHSHGCHSVHSCPSDHHTYIWYDGGGRPWSCARPGSPAYDPTRDTTLISFDGQTYYCYDAGSAPPSSVDRDGDGFADPVDACPDQAAPATGSGCPEGLSQGPPLPPAPTYVGRFRLARFGLPTAVKPRQLHPFSADDNAYLYGLRWRSWGGPRAYAKGKAAVNDCEPYCAAGRFVRRRGARATLYRLMPGGCAGKPANYYTRARLRFPRGLGLRPFTVKLVRGCGRS